MNHSRDTFNKLYSISYVFKNKPKLCANVPKVPINNFHVETKNYLESNVKWT